METAILSPGNTQPDGTEMSPRQLWPPAADPLGDTAAANTLTRLVPAADAPAVARTRTGRRNAADDRPDRR